MLRVLIALILTSSTALACGPDTDCVIGERTYRISMPESTASPVGAVVFAHGYRGSAAGMMSNDSFRNLIADQGLALISLESKGDAWSLPNSPSKPENQGLSEIAYVENVLDHAVANFPLDRDNLVMTGFSSGGMMVWQTLCERPELFRGYIPVSGTFWAPVPETCQIPATNVIHLHGDDDPTVPLSGRPIASTHQGDVPTAIAMYASLGGFGAPVSEQRGELRCDIRENPDGKILQFCLFEGGHSFKGKYIVDALNTLDRAR